MASKPYPPAHYEEPFPGLASIPPAASTRPGLVSHSLALQLRQLYSNELTGLEPEWRDRYAFLLARGFELRRRYKPGWTPSWLNVDVDPIYCEDAIEQMLPMVLDAKRRADGAIVCIKRINPEVRTDEVEIAKYLCSDHMLRDSRNHCVPIWDSFRDPIRPQVEYIVMPVLRPFNNPEFCAIGEVVDFVTQMIEGMEFMHRYLVAHGDLTTQNIMMDGRPIIPQGWHFMASNCAPNGYELLSPFARIDHPVRYFIIDFDCSLRLSPGQPHLVTGFGGRDGEPPEYTTRKAYDPFKIDVFTLGNVFFKDFYQKYEGLEFLMDLINYMKTRDFRERPTAQVVLQYWYSARARLDVAIARWRLRKRDETMGTRVVLDTVAAARESIHSVKRLLGAGERRIDWSNT